jgi:hypothetical protein
MKGAANEVDGWILEERSSLLVFLRGTERMDILRCIQWEWNGIGMGWDIYTLHIEMEYGVFGESGGNHITWTSYPQYIPLFIYSICF